MKIEVINSETNFSANMNRDDIFVKTWNVKNQKRWIWSFFLSYKIWILSVYKTSKALMKIHVSITRTEQNLAISN